MGQVGRATMLRTAIAERRSSGSRRPFVHATASAVMLVLGGCASQPADPGSAATVTTEASGASTAADQPTTTSSGRCPSGMGAAAQTPAQAAVCLHQAWEEGNRRSAAVFASLDVVDQLFVEGRASSEARFRGCRRDGHSEGEVCSYEHPGAEYRFQVRRSEGGWRVTEAQEAAT